MFEITLKRMSIFIVRKIKICFFDEKQTNKKDLIFLWSRTFAWIVVITFFLTSCYNYISLSQLSPAWNWMTRKGNWIVQHEAWPPLPSCRPMIAVPTAYTSHATCKWQDLQESKLLLFISSSSTTQNFGMGLILKLD